MGGVNRIRYLQVRLAENVDDQANSAQILTAIPSSITQEDFQRYYLSRVRQIMFGNTPGEHWYSDFLGQGIRPLSALSQQRVGIPLGGARDGTNRTYHTPENFFHDVLVTGTTIEVFSNGRRLIQTATRDPSVGDYWVSESGGTGTGFNTINLLTFTPVARTTLVSNYQAA